MGNEGTIIFHLAFFCMAYIFLPLLLLFKNLGSGISLNIKGNVISDMSRELFSPPPGRKSEDLIVSNPVSLS